MGLDSQRVNADKDRKRARQRYMIHTNARDSLHFYLEDNTRVE